MRHYHSILLLLMPAIISACVRPLNIDTDDSAVVVNCILSYPSPTQTLTLSYSVPNGEDDYVVIDDAEVSLYDQTTDTLAGTFISIGDGQWQAEITVIPGHQYKLDVIIDGQDPVSAITLVPECKVISFYPNGVVSWVKDMASSQSYHSLSSTNYDLSEFKIPVWVYIWNYDTITGQYSIGNRISSPFGNVDGFNLTGESVIRDTEWKEHTFTTSSTYFQKYLRIEPSENIINSIFITGDFKEPFYSALKENPSLHPDIQDNVTLYAEPSVIPNKGMGYVVAIAVSEEYDKYLKDVLIRQGKEEGTDISVLYDREQICTNINGGVGIFGSQLTYYLPWDEPIE